MQEARRRWTECRTFYQPIFDESRLDWRFYANDQWEKSLRDEREDAGKPCLTNNRISTFVRNVDNQIGSARLSAKVTAVSDATVEDAEIQQGLIKAIQTETEADIAYGCARKGMIVGGHGYTRVCTDYADWKSFDQNIKLERVLDPHTVMFDPNAKRPDRIDAAYCFQMCRETIEAAKRDYPDRDYTFQSFEDNGAGDWIQGDEFVWFTDYFYETWEDTTLCLWVDKQGAKHSDVLEDVPEGAKVIQTRPTQKRIIHWEKLDGLGVLKEYEWKGYYIPIVPMFGDEIIVDGQLQLVGLVRYLRDPQRMLNFWESAIAQTIGFAPIAPFVGFGEVIGRYQDDWENMNRKPKPILRIEAVPDGKGGFLPAPTRETSEPPIQAMVAGRSMTEQNLQAVSGLFDPSLGKGQADQSGSAIQSLQSQGNLATWNYTDSASRHIRHVARIIMDLAPYYYDAGRVMQIEGLDGQTKSVFVYNSSTNPNPDIPAEVKHALDLGKGSYAVTIDAAPSAQTQRADNVAFWMMMIQKFPQIMQVAGDLIVGEMDSPGAKAIAERLKTVLPPQVQALLAGQTPNPQAQQAQAQLQQAQAVIQKLLSERQSKSLELASKERIAAGGDATSIAVANINAMKDGSSALLDHEIQQLEAVLGHVGDQQQMAHESAMQAQDHEQQGQMADQTHQQGLEAQAVGHDQAMEQQENLPTKALPS